MRFVCQINLEASLFPNSTARMAYVVITDEDNGEFIDLTFDPNGGENAVILQLGRISVPTKAITRGPTLYRMVENPKQGTLTPEPCEFSVALIEDDDVMNEKIQNQIGGDPIFLQGDEFPFEGSNRLLLQLDSCSVPFSINFGDAGVGYALINEAGDQAKFLWQCC